MKRKVDHGARFALGGFALIAICGIGFAATLIVAGLIYDWRILAGILGICALTYVLGFGVEKWQRRTR